MEVPRGGRGGLLSTNKEIKLVASFQPKAAAGMLIPKAAGDPGPSTPISVMVDFPPRMRFGNWEEEIVLKCKKFHPVSVIIY